LTHGPAAMTDRPPPPAAPKSDHRSDRPCHTKVASQTHCLQKLERANTTVVVPKNSAQVSKVSDPKEPYAFSVWGRDRRRKPGYDFSATKTTTPIATGRDHPTEPPRISTRWLGP